MAPGSSGRWSPRREGSLPRASRRRRCDLPPVRRRRLPLATMPIASGPIASGPIAPGHPVSRTTPPDTKAGGGVSITNGAATTTSGRPFNPAARDNRPLVLVVDDEESYRQALASGLTREGFTVESAGDGHEALRLFH